VTCSHAVTPRPAHAAGVHTLSAPRFSATALPVALLSQISQKEISAYLADAEAKPGLRNFAKPQCIRWQPKPVAAKPSKR
jgi:hypothetical protein